MMTFTLCVPLLQSIDGLVSMDLGFCGALVVYHVQICIVLRCSLAVKTYDICILCKYALQFFFLLVKPFSAHISYILPSIYFFFSSVSWLISFLMCFFFSKAAFFLLRLFHLFFALFYVFTRIKTLFFIHSFSQQVIVVHLH